ncbi:hypothetical protein AAZX31_13G126300 [Glycine max]|uniref:Uncharacterized protein n=1 Tax=Glycine soja TaxID=3848 RepID=A0A445HFS2_GLYSO|nr:uncharacterized protein LOC114380791 [Glycine soja]KAG4970563.1 hypothetical protein JHK85_036984 [Glycine max]KAG4959539.1 hypothetical protein JHK87_036172 [Glycine soja]KAG4976968.1 hypothetical protein JHK86_036442 [Glycine max]KAG5112984.1 hypothetical protein JHK82_036253 [Glycine max]KAG5130264.1 hypothetical protein JHK84_036661 [Glycine max]
MEKYFGNAYRGDPGVPHSDPDRFVNIWVGSAAFAVLTYFNPYMWQLSNQFNWHDKAMLYEQYHWKQARKKNQPYEFLWNKTWDKNHREHYYYNWPIYFP